MNNTKKIIALAAAVWAYIKQDSFLFNDKF